jgi:hypothetical protein
MGNDFDRFFLLRIGEITGTPAGEVPAEKTLGRNERIAAFPKVRTSRKLCQRFALVG